MSRRATRWSGGWLRVASLLSLQAAANGWMSWPEPAPFFRRTDHCRVRGTIAGNRPGPARRFWHQNGKLQLHSIGLLRHMIDRRGVTVAYKLLARLAMFVVASSLVVGCQRQPTFITELAPISQIEAPSGNYREVAWLTDNQLIIQYEVDGSVSNYTNLLWSLTLDSADLRALELPKPEQTKCTALFFEFPSALPDGRLAFERHCHKDGADFFDIYLMYWDPITRKSGLLYQHELPRRGPYTFAPDLRRGLLSSVTGIEDQLFWLDTSGTSALDLDLVRANRPAWSSNGRIVAFVGNRKLSGPAGPGWAIQPYDLWIMPTDCETMAGGCDGALRLIVSGIYRITTLQWSPDGEWLAFSGTVNNSDQGVWILRPSTTTLIEVALGDYAMPTWSPDGSQIAVIGPPVQFGSDSYRTTLYQIDVGTIVAEATTKP